MTRTTIQSTDITDGSIVNSDVNASAAIVASKLSGVESGLTSVQTFTSSGTWTRPTGITKVIVEIQGAGGSGTDGNSTSVGMNNGASGGYVKKLIDVSSITSATITVGTGGAASSTTTGNAGGDSVWSDGTNTLTAGGGGGGLSTTHYGGIGGTAVRRLFKYCRSKWRCLRQKIRWKFSIWLRWYLWSIFRIRF